MSTPPGSVTYLYILGSIALFTLVIACINFMNLSTARSSKRSAEVGVRKVLGAERKALIRQFLGESVMMSLIAFAFAIVITQIYTSAFCTGFRKTFYNAIQATGIIVRRIFCPFSGYRFISRKLSCFLFILLQTCKSFKRKVFKFAGGRIASQIIGSISICYFSGSDHCLGSDRQPNELLTSKDLGFVKDQQIVLPLRGVLWRRNSITSLKTEMSKNPRQSFPSERRFTIREFLTQATCPCTKKAQRLMSRNGFL